MNGIIDRFCKRKYLRRKHTIRIESNNNRKYVYLDDPLVLARLTGHLKHNLGRPNKGYQIFLRGQANDHRAMVPSIFRNLPNTSNNYRNRLDAYNELIHELPRLKNLKRFRGQIGGAILQHYGIRTPWLDLVDNLFVAVWFATHERSQDEPFRYIKKREEDCGWVYFIQVEDPLEKNLAQYKDGLVMGQKTMWCDLRCYHTSLSLRAHTQHGIYASRYGFNETNFDLNEFVVASVKFPVTSAFKRVVDDFKIIATGYMFPSSYYDNTYKTLRQNEVTRLIRNVERNNHLEEGEIGRIYKYQNGPEKRPIKNRYQVSTFD